MLRMLFLLLVIVGAFAAVFALVLGVGVMRMSAPAVTVAVPGPSTQQPAASSAAVSVSEPEPAKASAPSVPPAPSAPAPVAPPAQARPDEPALRGEPPAMPGIIVLKPEDAALKGNSLRLLPDGELRFGSRKGASAVWAMPDTPAGEYYVDLTYAADDDGGGEIVVQVSQDGGDSFTADIEPTGAVDKYRMIRHGTLHFTGKRKTGLIIRSVRANDEDLMRLRKIELVPRRFAPIAAAARLAARDDAERPEDRDPADLGDGGAVTGLSLIDTRGGAALGRLTDRSTLNLSARSPSRLSLRADVAGRVKSVRFRLDGDDDHLENNAPFTIAGDEGSKAEPWKIAPGEHTLVVTPYAERDGRGGAGRALVVRFKAVRGDEDQPLVKPR